MQEKAKLERSASQRQPPTSKQPPAPIRRVAQNVDLIGDEVPGPPARPSTTDNVSTRPPPPRSSTPSKQLLGLDDFFGAPPDRPASTSSNQLGSTAPSRPDLKQSILSLYATAPRPQPPQQPQPERQASFGSIQSSATQQPASFGGLDDAFSGLSFATSTSSPAPQPQQQAKQSPFANLGSISSHRSAPAPPQITSPPPLSGGGFFDTGPKPLPKTVAATKPSQPPLQTQRQLSSSSGFGDFASSLNQPAASSFNQAGATSLNGLYDFSTEPPLAPSTAKPSLPPTNINSAFNLSAPAPASHSVTKAAPASQNSFSGFSNVDAWGSNDAWAAAEPSTTGQPTKQNKKSPSISAAATQDFGWGSGAANSTTGGGSGFGVQAPPKIAAEEDFGGWNSAAPTAPAGKNIPQQTKPAGGFGGSEDLFSNVWE